MTTQDEDRNRLLSDAERTELEALEYDPNEDNAAALAEIGRGALDAAQPKDGDDDDDDDAGDEDAGDEDAGPDAGAAEPDAVAADAPEPDADAAGATPATPQAGYKVELPADFDEQLKANKAALSAARKAFNDGELDVDQFDAQVSELEDARDTLRDLKTRATIATEMRAQSEQDNWVNAVHAFVADVAASPALGQIDYRKDVAKQADWDAFVKALANAKGNENKPARWYLEEAHKRVLALHGITPAGKAAPAAPAKRRADPAGVVTTLADVPGGAGDTNPLDGEFSELDKLKGLEYERAIERLRDNPEKYDRYMRS
jgi:hypothetical protein